MSLQKVYSSRSRLEVFGDCNRKGYIEFLWGGRGIVKNGASVYLSTGTYTHVGLELIFNAVKNNISVNGTRVIDDAVAIAVGSYRDEIKNRGFDLEDGEDRANEIYVVEEQCALVEGFIRAFCVVVLPDLLSRYRVVDVEREEILEEGSLIIQGKIDVILEEIETSDIYIVSFKTAANWDRRQEKANEHDNQGLSETLLLEARLNKDNYELHKLVDACTEVTLEGKVKEATQKYLQYIKKFAIEKKVMGVLMIYFLKGKRSESSKGSGKWVQNNPLTRAYKKLTGVDYEYAPSLFFEKPENKSGWGRLGKGWEAFNTWEEEGGVKAWIQKLANDDVPGGLQTLKDLFKIPAPYFRNQEHMDSWLRQARAVEQDIIKKLRDLNGAARLMATTPSEGLDYYFPQRRKGCHYPSDCSYIDVCYNTEIFNDPIGSGKYVYRTPHHEAELREHERLFTISNRVSIGGSSGNDNKADGEIIEE